MANVHDCILDDTWIDWNIQQEQEYVSSFVWSYLFFFILHFQFVFLTVVMMMIDSHSFSSTIDTRDALIAAKYGDDFNKMTPIEQDYVKKQITMVMQSNR